MGESPPPPPPPPPKEKWQEDRAKENAAMEELLPLKPWGLALHPESVAHR